MGTGLFKGRITQFFRAFRFGSAVMVDTAQLSQIHARNAALDRDIRAQLDRMNEQLTDIAAKVDKLKPRDSKLRAFQPMRLPLQAVEMPAPDVVGRGLEEDDSS